MDDKQTRNSEIPEGNPPSMPEIPETSNENPAYIAESSTEKPITMEELSGVTPIANTESSEENPKPIEDSTRDEPSSIVEPLKENPSSADGTSQENTTENFSFQVHPAIIMKQALACLTEEQFNPGGLGMIEVEEVFGLGIIVDNSEIGDMGHLWLKATTGLINFKCNKAMAMKRVNLSHIFENLVDAADQDVITIRHLDGSNQLFFSFGSDPPRQFSAELLQLDDCYKKFPKMVTTACDVIVQSDHLRQMIEEYQAAIESKKLVQVDIYDEDVNVFIGQKTWNYHYIRGSKADGIMGMKEGWNHHACFQWPHCEFLKKASLMVPAFYLCFSMDPPQHIMLRFCLRELGDLMYLNKSVLTLYNFPDSDEFQVETSYSANIDSLV